MSARAGGYRPAGARLYVTSYPLSLRLARLRNTLRDAAEPGSPIDDRDALETGLRIVGTIYQLRDAHDIIRLS